jgi:long-chain acyl-CoA synthetase
MKTNETLVYRFWSHVFNTPDKPGALIKDNAYRYDPVGWLHRDKKEAEGKYFPIGWAQCGERVATIMTLLSRSGCKQGDRVAILAWNSPEWVWCNLAIQSLGATTVPIYPNTAAEQVNELLADSGASFIICDDKEQSDKVRADSPVKTLSFADIDPPALLTKGFTTNDEQKFWTQRSNRLESIKSELAKGPEGFLGIDPNELANFIYTSGSTGRPKGVMMSHGNIASACASLGRHGLTLSPNDVALSYLPAAHVYEFVDGQAVCIWYGVPAAYCKTADMAGELQKVRPTILLGVPAVWRKMKDKIQSQLDSATGVKKLAVKLAFANIPLLSTLAGLLVFKTIRAGLGGNLRLLMSGGAPISKDILEFFGRVGLPLREGYGLSETAGALSLNTLSENVYGTVGTVLDCCEVRIVALEGAEDAESGEIWVRGDIVFKGYWNMPEETAKAITDDGWFKTGDLGKFVTIGGKQFLKITGRKKRLLKTDGGKYVAPEKIEKAFDGEPLIGFIVPVGDGKPYISALVFVNEMTCQDLLKAKGIALPAGTTVAEQYGRQPEVKKTIDAALDAAKNERNGSLEHWETVKYLVIVPQEATVANGLLTATLKIRTEEVLKRYKDLIESIYSSNKR